jgi:hypothetical protein
MPIGEGFGRWSTGKRKSDEKKTMRRFAAPRRLATLASAAPRSGAPFSKCNPCADHQVLPMRCPDSTARPTFFRRAISDQSSMFFHSLDNHSPDFSPGFSIASMFHWCALPLIDGSIK